MSGARIRVSFCGQRVVQSLEVTPNASLLAVAVRARLPIGRSCRGQGVCFACKVEIVEGAENLSPRAEAEATLAPNERLACLCYVRGPITIRTPYW